MSKKWNQSEWRTRFVAELRRQDKTRTLDGCIATADDIWNTEPNCETLDPVEMAQMEAKGEL